MYYIKQPRFAYAKLSGTIPVMSFLFHEKTKKAMKWIWIVVASMIVISMVFAYSGGSGLF
jgi:hypothetical protein